MSKFRGFPKSHEYITKLFMSCYTYLFTDKYILGHGAIRVGLWTCRTRVWHLMDQREHPLA